MPFPAPRLAPVTATQRAKGLTHADPADTTLQEVLSAVGDPIRRSILRQVASEPDFTRRYNRLRRAEFDARFPGLLALVLGEKH
jgi:hypothetical protein